MNTENNDHKNGGHDLIRPELQLGQMCFNRGEYTDAERAFRRALTIAESQGRRDELLSACLLNLATVLCVQGKHEQADPLYRRLLALDESVLGSASTEYAMDLNNVAAHYRRMERYGEAEQLYQRAMKIFRRIPEGDKDPDYALLLNNLGLLYCEQGRCNNAEPLLREALTIRETCFGTKHQYVGETLLNLAGLLVRNRRDEEADELFQRGISIFQYTLGPDHPELKEARLDYAEALHEMGRTTEALDLEAKIGGH